MIGVKFTVRGTPGHKGIGSRELRSRIIGACKLRSLRWDKRRKCYVSLRNLSREHIRDIQFDIIMAEDQWQFNCWIEHLEMVLNNERIWLINAD